MAGYDYESWKSNRAVDAEERGQLPAGKLAKEFGVPTLFVTENLAPLEWHHTSSRYNRTNYYSSDVLSEFLDTEKGKAALAECRLGVKRSKKGKTYLDCDVEWLVWGGSVKRPIPTERSASGATVLVKGVTATITLADGTVFKKRLSTNGFSFTPASVDSEGVAHQDD